MAARFKVVLLVCSCLYGISDQASAQQPNGSETGKWELEIHGGGVRVSNPTGATTAMPAPGQAFTTRNDRPSRYVSSWYFGDGALLLNQQLAAFTALPRAARITPLDPVLTRAARPSNTGSVGVRVGRRLSPRFTAEFSVDYGPAPIDLPDDTLSDIEASRASFASVWRESLGPGMPFENAVVSSSSEIEEHTGGQIVATGALTARLRRGGAFVPFVTGGFGGVFHRGSDTSVTLRGNYSAFYTLGESFNFNGNDNVTVRWARPDRAVVGLLGGGFTYDLARRHGLRVDLRVHVRPNAIDTEISASPTVQTGTPGRAIASATTPSVQTSSTPSERSTLSGPAITAFKTRQGSGVRIDTALTIGYYWRF